MTASTPPNLDASSEPSDQLLSGAGVCCPECGYDLRGIPERRCPECGFGYDHAGIRSLARQRNYERDLAHRRTIASAAFAAALTASPIIEGWNLPWVVQLAVIAGALFAAFVVRRACADPVPPGLFDSPWYAGWLTASFIAAGLFVSVPVFAAVLATALNIRALFLWARASSGRPEAAMMASPEEQRLLRGRARLATLGVVGATVLVCLSWM